MPTGYTARVVNGTMTEFKEFALNCARAFGACIDMRDDAMDKPIPEAFAPSSYHTDHIAELRAELTRLNSMSYADLQLMAMQDFQQEIVAEQEYKDRLEQENVRIDQMLGKVQAWKAPPDHVGLKRFMVEQLKISRNTPYPRPKPIKLDAMAWLSRQVDRIARDIAYHDKEHAEEIKRTAERNKWLKDLRASL